MNQWIQCNWKNKKILIVEDEISNATILKATLQNSSSQIVMAYNGKEAIEKMDDSIDLILMDIRMPEMDGYEATKIIRIKYKNVPIIIQSAYTLNENQKTFIKANCNGHLYKPFNFNKLTEQLNLFLSD